MTQPSDEAQKLRSAALHNASGVSNAASGAHEELRQSSELLRVTLASIGDAVISTDAQGRVTLMNRVAETLTGWSQQDALGRALRDVFRIVNKDSRAPLECPALQVLREGAAVEPLAHSVLIATDAAEHPIESNSAPIRSSDGRILGAVLIFRDISSRTAADEALRASEKRLRLATDAAHLGIWVWDLVDNHVRWENDRPYEIFGIPPTEPPLSHSDFLAQFLDPADVPAFESAVKAAISGERPFYFLGRIRRRDAHLRWVEFTGIAKRHGGKPPVRMVGTAADVTERLLAEARTRQAAEANAKFHAMFDQGSQFAGILSLDGTVVEVNRLALEACGFSREQIIGKPFWECGWWNRDPSVAGTVRKATLGAADGRTFRAESPYFVADGTKRHVDLVIAPVTDEEGRVLFIAPTGTDITDRIRAQEALRESQEQSERQRRLYEAILTNTPDFAYVFDHNHRFIYANDILLKMFGRTRENGIGKTFLELGYEPWHAEMHIREIDHVIATKQPIRGEVPFDGTFGRRIYDYIFVPIIGADGEVEAVAGTTRDVTDRKNAEIERESLLSSERSARAEAERAGRIKDEFLATLSHELRTPLNAILGWTYLLSKGPPTPESLSQGLSVIDRNARMQAKLISDLLDMSRIISGKMRLDVQRIELPVVIESAIDSIRPAAEAREVRIQSVLEPVTDPVHGDPARLQQIVWNLVSNAVKFTPRGGRVQVVLARVNSHVEISVSDTGKGIEPSFLPHVFERFRQGDSTAAREHGGLGLGLAIVKQLVELHGGSVHVASEGVGRGATFTVRLPLAAVQFLPSELPRTHPRAVDLSPVHGDRPDLNGVNVLVVDDELDARDLVKRVLEECSARVTLAASADEAIAAIARQAPDVILSDIGMPERDGYAFMTAVRQSGVKSPAAALTAFARSEDRTRALRAGYQTHIAKPVEPAELLATVAALIHKTAPTGR